MAKKNQEIKVEVRFTEGYRRRFTEACLKVAEEHVEREWRERERKKEVTA